MCIFHLIYNPLQKIICCIFSGPHRQLNGVSQLGTPMFWHGTPMLGHSFHPVGFENTSYPHSHSQRPPSYDMSMMPRSPYGIPSFVPPIFPR